MLMFMFGAYLSNGAALDERVKDIYKSIYQIYLYLLLRLHHGSYSFLIYFCL